MDTKKIYPIISLILAIIFCYSLFWLVKVLFEYSYVFQFRFLASYIPTFLGVIGLTIFITSKFKRSNVLKIYMCFDIISLPFIALYYIRIFKGIDSTIFRTIEIPWTFYLSACLYLCSLISSIIGLRVLSFNKITNLSFINENERIAQFFPAPASLRFTNRLIDAVIILYVLWSNASSVISYFSLHESPTFYLLFEIPLLLFYYIILEGLFNTTAGKCATNTIIVNMQGERPSFAQILGRSFSRLIPFEAFSFFGADARGWHDTLTYTYVTGSINKEDFEMNEFTLNAELNNNTNEGNYSAG